MFKIKLYNSYLFKKLTNSFLGNATILVLLIWFSKTISFVRYVTENGIELSKFFMLFILILPNLLIFIIPIALFIAVISTYNRLIRDNEIAILKSSGLTKIQIGKSTIWLAIIASAFCFLVSSILMPYANKKLRMSRIDFGNNYASLLFNPGTFETINNLTIYTKNRDEEGNLSGILLHD